MKVLVVDDEQLVRWFLQRALTKKGYEVTVVSSTQEAELLLQNENYDLIISDLRMPTGDGAPFINRLVESGTHPPIIACSAYITPELDKDFRLKGVYTLKKPFKLSELEEALQRVLNP
ncbi:MAG TPA: response regulator [Nitrospirae bacterium]|nr:response regulator [Nitrospirota bacterium]